MISKLSFFIIKDSCNIFPWLFDSKIFRFLSCFMCMLLQCWVYTDKISRREILLYVLISLEWLKTGITKDLANLSLIGKTTTRTTKHLMAILRVHIERSEPEWYISSMLYSRDIPFWSGTLDTDVWSCKESNPQTLSVGQLAGKSLWPFHN